MNFSQKLGILCLILITSLYIYFSFFGQNELNIRKQDNSSKYESIKKDEQENPETKESYKKEEIKNVKIFITDSNGNLRSVNRKCDTGIEKSCFSYAIKELVSAPTEWEKKKGLSSEIPPLTKILSIRESSNNILIDLSSSF